MNTIKEFYSDPNIDLKIKTTRTFLEETAFSQYFDAIIKELEFQKMLNDHLSDMNKDLKDKMKLASDILIQIGK